MHAEQAAQPLDYTQLPYGSFMENVMVHGDENVVIHPMQGDFGEFIDP